MDTYPYRDLLATVYEKAVNGVAGMDSAIELAENYMPDGYSLGF